MKSIDYSYYYEGYATYKTRRAIKELTRWIIDMKQ